MKRENAYAFPGSLQEGGNTVSHAKGMTLRDWFAGQALAAQSAMPFRFRAPPEDCARGVAERCYTLADAMLAHRENGHED